MLSTYNRNGYIINFLFLGHLNIRCHINNDNIDVNKDSFLKKQFEEVITDKGVTIFIDPSAVMFLMGCEMDWKEEKFSSGFVFKSSPFSFTPASQRRRQADLCFCATGPDRLVDSVRDRRR